MPPGSPAKVRRRQCHVLGGCKKAGDTEDSLPSLCVQWSGVRKAAPFCSAGRGASVQPAGASPSEHDEGPAFPHETSQKGPAAVAELGSLWDSARLEKLALPGEKFKRFLKNS